MSEKTIQPPQDWNVRIIQALAVLGIVVSYYLYLFHEGVLSLTCTVNTWLDCGKVSGPQGEFSSIGPMPVALLGLLGYIAIFAVIWLADWSSWVRSYQRELLAGLVGFAFLFSLGLTALEAFVIHAFCQYCLYSLAIITGMFVLMLFSFRKNQ